MIHARFGMNGKAAQMQFVNDGFGPGMPEWLIAGPVKRLVDMDAFRHRLGIIKIRDGQVALR